LSGPNSYPCLGVAIIIALFALEAYFIVDFFSSVPALSFGYPNLLTQRELYLLLERMECDEVG
jgi:hypothetical protein